jgi:hypothetical protein
MSHVSSEPDLRTTDGAIRKYLGLAAAAVAFFGVFAAGPAWAQVSEGCPAPAPQAIDFSQPLNLDLIKNRLVYYRCTQYDADVAKSLAEAGMGWHTRTASEQARHRPRYR